MASIAAYNDQVPYTSILSSAKLFFGMVYGVDKDGASWLEKLIYDNSEVQCSIVLIIYPACQTRENTLMKLLELQNTTGDRFKFAIYPIPLFAGHPANALLIADTQGKKYLVTGSSPVYF